MTPVFFLSDIHELQMCIQNTVEHLRWNFFGKQLTAKSTEAAQSYDILLHHSVLQYFQTERQTTTKKE